MAALIAFVVFAVFLGFTAAFAVPWLVIVPIAVVLAFLAWGATMAAARRTPQEVVRRTKRPELLGPGGPDDPEA